MPAGLKAIATGNSEWKPSAHFRQNRVVLEFLGISMYVSSSIDMRGVDGCLSNVD